MTREGEIFKSEWAKIARELNEHIKEKRERIIEKGVHTLYMYAENHTKRKEVFGTLKENGTDGRIITKEEFERQKGRMRQIKMKGNRELKIKIIKQWKEETIKQMKQQEIEWK